MGNADVHGTTVDQDGLIAEFADLLIAIVSAAGGGLYIYASLQYPGDLGGPWLFPVIVGTALAALGLWGLFQHRVALLRIRSATLIAFNRVDRNAARSGFVYVALIAYVFLLEPIGFIASTAIFALSMWAIRPTLRRGIYAVSGIVITILLDVLFFFALGVTMP